MMSNKQAGIPKAAMLPKYVNPIVEEWEILEKLTIDIIAIWPLHYIYNRSLVYS